MLITRLTGTRLAALAAATVIALAAFATGDAAAGPGDLDSTFGNGGITSLPPEPLTDVPVTGVALQSDGKIVTAGHRIEPPSSFPGISARRFNADGSLDLPFGGGDGLALIEIPGSLVYGYSVAVQSDGKILVGGERWYGSPVVYEFVVARFNGDGSPDPSFTGDLSNKCAAVTGVVCTQVSDAPGTDRGIKLALTTGGKFVLAGTAYTDPGPSRFAAVRYTSDGSLDSSFDSDGRVTAQLGSYQDNVQNVIAQPDGKLVLIGTAHAGSLTTHMGFVRLLENGALDPAFDGDANNLYAASSGNGRVIIAGTPFAADSEAYAAAIQPGGKIVAAGFAEDPSIYVSASATSLIRLSADGSLDTSFASGGRLIWPLGTNYSSFHAVTLDGKGRLLLGGFADNVSAGNDFVAARVTSEGAPDPSFGSGGSRTIVFPEKYASVSDLLLQPDGRLLLAGSNGFMSIGLARLKTEPDPPAVAAVPTAKILSPARKVLKRAALKKLAGVAGPPGAVKQVEIALRRVDGPKKRCAWLSSPTGKFKFLKARRGKCSAPYFRLAKGGERWSYRLRRALPAGRYLLFVRVTLVSGERNSTFSAAAGNLRSFRLR